MHDMRDYDRCVDFNRRLAAERIARHNDAYSKKAVDTRIALIAQGLRTAMEADPDALRGLDVWLWAERIAASLLAPSWDTY